MKWVRFLHGAVLCQRDITWGNLGCSSPCGTIQCTLAVRHAFTFLPSPDALTTGLNRYFYIVLGCVKFLLSAPSPPRIQRRSWRNTEGHGFKMHVVSATVLTLQSYFRRPRWSLCAVTFFSGSRKIWKMHVFQYNQLSVPKVDHSFMETMGSSVGEAQVWILKGGVWVLSVALSVYNIGQTLASLWFSTFHQWNTGDHGF